MPNVVPFRATVLTAAPAPPAGTTDHDEIVEAVSRLPLEQLGRAAGRARVQAAVAKRRGDRARAAELLYFAGYCLARLADETLDPAGSSAEICPIRSIR